MISKTLTNFMSKLVTITMPLRYAYHRYTYMNAKSHGEYNVESLKDKYKDKPLIIVGNGPSLNQTPLDMFANIPAIGMNKISMIYSRTTWRPSIVVAVNDLVVKQSSTDMMYDGIEVYLAWKSRGLVPSRIRNKYGYFLTLAKQNFSKDISRGVGVSATVTYTALQFAYYMGANPVILLGVDHSFKVEGSPHQIQKREGTDCNHFDPNYFKSGSYWGLPDLVTSEVGYSLSKDIFEKSGRKIYDATVGGQLQIFDKISIEEARSLCDSYENL